MPGKTIAASRFAGYQTPAPLDRPQRTAGIGMTSPPATPPSSPRLERPETSGTSSIAVAATTPKTNCEAMNQGQSTSLAQQTG